MNSDREALSFYLTNVFTRDPEGRLVYCSEIWPFLVYFLTDDEAVAYYRAENAGKFNVKGYLRIQACFRDIATDNWGPNIVTKDSKARRLVLKLKPRYNFDEVPYTFPGKSRNLRIYNDINGCALGISKLAMKREVPVPLPVDIPYCHVGLTLRRADGGLDFVELRVDPSSARVEVRDCLQAVNDNEIKAFVIDNRTIRHRGNVYPVKTLYRLSKIIGKKVSYGVLSFNCDHVANFLLTSRIEWTNYLWEVPENTAIPAFPLGDIQKNDLLEIEAHISRHENIKLQNQG